MWIQKMKSLASIRWVRTMYEVRLPGGSTGQKSELWRRRKPQENQRAGKRRVRIRIRIRRKEAERIRIKGKNKNKGKRSGKNFLEGMNRHGNKRALRALHNPCSILF